MATITTRFSLGDTVYTVAKRRGETAVSCVACESTGKVSLAGALYVCPACGGRKVRGAAEIAVSTGKVDRIRVTNCERACRVQYFVDGAWLEVAQVFSNEAAARASMGG